MSRLSEVECDQFVGCYLSCACMGIGNIVLKFIGTKSAWIDVAMNTKFQVTTQGRLELGDGASPITISILYPVLNLAIERVTQTKTSNLEIFFEGGGTLLILPRGDGYESYVVYLPGVAGGVVCF